MLAQVIPIIIGIIHGVLLSVAIKNTPPCGRDPSSQLVADRHVLEVYLKIKFNLAPHYDVYINIFRQHSRQNTLLLKTGGVA
jgi:hypothetical protein